MTGWDLFLATSSCPRMAGGSPSSRVLVAQEGRRSKMADTAAPKEYSMTEVATHTTKESTWLVIKDMNDGGK